MTNDDKQLDQVIQMVRQTTVPPFPREQLQLELPAKPAHTIKKREWSRQIMRYRIPAATAATIALVCLAAVWNWGPLGGQKSFALQQVGEAFARVKTVQFKYTITGWKGKQRPDPLISTIYYDGSVRTKQEGELSLHVMDWKSARFTAVNYEHEKATIKPIYGGADGKWASEHSRVEFFELIRTAAATAAVRTEKTTEDGQKVVEFSWSHGGQDQLVTVDADTMLPVRIEKTRRVSSDTVLRLVHSDFVYDQPMDDSLFEVEIPEGFTVEEWKPDPNNTSYPDEDAEQLVVAPDSFGPVKAGMTAAEAVELLGTPDRITRSRAPSKSENYFLRLLGGDEIVELDYSSRGFTLSLLPRSIHKVSCVSQTSTGPWVRDFAGRTAEGIRLGDSRQKVLDTYGKPDNEADESVRFTELGWTFEIRNGKVIGMYFRPSPDE